MSAKKQSLQSPRRVVGPEHGCVSQNAPTRIQAQYSPLTSDVPHSKTSDFYFESSSSGSFLAAEPLDGFDTGSDGVRKIRIKGEHVQQDDFRDRAGISTTYPVHTFLNHQSNSQPRHSAVTNESKSQDALHDLSREGVPTDERMQELRKRWIDRDVLSKRLLYCAPFIVMLAEPAISYMHRFTPFSEWRRDHRRSANSKRMVMKTQRELLEYLQDNNWDAFAAQISDSWPDTFGSLVMTGKGAPYFRWQPNSTHLGDGISYICRKSLLTDPGTLLMVLFHGFNIDIYAGDNMMWQIMPRITTSLLTMSTIAFLESLFAPTHPGFVSLGTLSDWFSIQKTSPVLQSTGDFGNGNWLCVQFNMRTCVPDDAGLRVKQFEQSLGISPQELGFPLRRQAARIPSLSKGKDQFAVEFLLSASIVLRKRQNANGSSTTIYTIVVWVDYQTDFETRSGSNPILQQLSNRIDLDLHLKDCGKDGAGVFQYLVVLVRVFDYWKTSWDAMMDKIDDIVSVQLQDTLDKKRWEMLMFDDSFQLSEQYFTVLQLLRIYQDWIDEVSGGFESLQKKLLSQCRSWQNWSQQHAPAGGNKLSLNMKNLEGNLEKVKAFCSLRVDHLQERIERKKEEVEGLRDGLMNAASLREALKAKTLNLYIGVFTTITVLFTPLAFVAAFWAIPFMGPNSQTSAPNGFITSFVIVPIVTYLVSAVFIIFLWSRSSQSFRGIVPDQAWNSSKAVFKRLSLLIPKELENLGNRARTKGFKKRAATYQETSFL